MLALNEEQLLPLSRATLPLLQVGWDKQTNTRSKEASEKHNRKQGSRCLPLHVLAERGGLEPGRISCRTLHHWKQKSPSHWHI